MTFLRHHRYRIGIFLAAMIFATGGPSGLVAAAQGVQLQTPLCTAGGPEPADNSDSTGETFDHCQICPLATALSGNARSDQSSSPTPYARSAVEVPAGTVPAAHARAELMPLTGRAPPFRS
jgi:hypothetical protein